MAGDALWGGSEPIPEDELYVHIYINTSQSIMKWSRENNKTGKVTNRAKEN